MVSAIWMHYLADFLLQNDEMALNKSKNTTHGVVCLVVHCLIYAVCFIPLGYSVLWLFWSHLIIDGISSRVCAKLYERHRHWFFCVIGLDQALHLTILRSFYENVC